MATAISVAISSCAFVSIAGLALVVQDQYARIKTLESQVNVLEKNITEHRDQITVISQYITKAHGAQALSQD